MAGDAKAGFVSSAGVMHRKAGNTFVYFSGLIAKRPFLY